MFFPMKLTKFLRTLFCRTPLVAAFVWRLVERQTFVQGIMLSSNWENLSRCCTRLIHCCKKTTTCIELQTKQILSVNIYCTYFFQFWAWPLRFLFNVIFKVPASWYKKNLNKFLLHCTFLFMSSKSVSYFKLDLLIFLSFVVSFLVLF